MLQKEQRYEFKRKLLKVHKEDIRDMSLIPSAEEFELLDGISIVLPEGKHDVIYTAAKDFADYLFVSMRLSSVLSCSVKTEPSIRLELNQDLDEVSSYMGHRITVDNCGVLIEGYDERGIAQALYYLEEQMSFRKAPFLKKGVLKRKALFSPRYAQSPMGFMEYPDEVLSRMAHLGYDAIFTWIKNSEVTMDGHRLDLMLLCERAEKYGLDVYATIFFEHTANPADEGAQEFYDSYYGKLFTDCPKLKGIELVGEGHYFHSRDTRVQPPSPPKDHIPTGKPSAGWFPCNDYPQLLEMIQKAIYKHRPDAEIIFCTYNWGYTPKEDRIRLIEALPDGIILMPSWDMFQVKQVAKDVTEMVRDYSLSTYAASDYFASEAIAAKKRGMRCYADGPMSGRTWDFGVIPYLPMPYQWIKRYRAFLKAREEWDICGLGEDIHYGFYPSFVSDMLKYFFFTENEPLEVILDKILISYYGDSALEEVKHALQLWSDAITYMIPTGEDQYGALRIVPHILSGLEQTKESVRLRQMSCLETRFTRADILPAISRKSFHCQVCGYMWSWSIWKSFVIGCGKESRFCSKFKPQMRNCCA